SLPPSPHLYTLSLHDALPISIPTLVYITSCQLAKCWQQIPTCHRFIRLTSWLDTWSFYDKWNSNTAFIQRPFSTSKGGIPHRFFKNIGVIQSITDRWNVFNGTIISHEKNVGIFRNTQ